MNLLALTATKISTLIQSEHKRKQRDRENHCSTE